MRSTVPVDVPCHGVVHNPRSQFKQIEIRTAVPMKNTFLGLPTKLIEP
jgi:hypothetical protein